MIKRILFRKVKDLMRKLLAAVAIAVINGLLLGNLPGDGSRANVVYASGVFIQEGATNPALSGGDVRKTAAVDAVSQGTSGYIAPEIYDGLIDDLVNVGKVSHLDTRINIDGEVRYHYAANSGYRQLQDSSGLRVYLALDKALARDWKVYAKLEGKKDLLNYDNNVKFSRLYVKGKFGDSTMQAGSFGYLMADGNIYDSGFDGIRADFTGPLKYTLSYGQTNYTKETSIATVRYDDFDYNLEAGIYHYQADDGRQNTIRTFGGNYNFSNLGIGAMAFNSSRKDSKGNGSGYVLGLNYGDLKSWRPGTFGAFAKYYDQPEHTYIAHGMNGIGGRMQGFKGYGLGIQYTVAQNVVAGIEYYDMTDKVTGEKGQTLWGQLTHYF